MDSRRKALVLMFTMVGLFGFHLWLLQRTLGGGDLFLSSLLTVAVALFSWRIVHYWTRFRGAPEQPATIDTVGERTRIRNWSLVLVALLGLHAWLFLEVFARGEVIFALLLVVAIAVFLYRLVYYAARYAQLRGAVAPMEIAPEGEAAKAHGVEGSAEGDPDDVG